MEAKVRNSNIELLRIILMFSIVVWHLIVHGTGLDPTNTNIISYQKVFYASFVLFPVDCFIIISGYFGINLKFKKIALLILQTIFYSILSMVAFSFFIPVKIDFNFIMMRMFSFLTSEWWFISTYIFLMLLSPILNFISDKISQELFKYTLIVGFILNSIVGFLYKDVHLSGDGSTLINFIFIYLIGRYMFKYKIESFKIQNKAFVFFICGILTFLMSSIYFREHNYSFAWHFFAFNSPFVLISAISIFEIFKNINFGYNKYVNFVSSTTLGIYLIHDSNFFREYIIKKFININEYSNNITYGLWLIVFGASIFAVCFIIDKTREFLFVPVSKILDKVEQKYFSNIFPKS